MNSIHPRGTIWAPATEPLWRRNSPNRAQSGAEAQIIEPPIIVPARSYSATSEAMPSGTASRARKYSATAPDWARFGEFLRHKGSVAGAQIVPRGWIEFMTAPSPRAPDYGAMTWLNRKSGGEREVLFPDEGPADAFAAVGHLGQYVIVSPRQRLTVVRLGKTDDADRAALVDALAEIVALYPET